MALHIEGTVTEKELLDTDLYRIKYKSPQRIDFKAGQFMSILVGNSVRRSYSLSNSPEESDVLETYADVSPHGPAYTYFNAVQIGDKAEILVPLGEFAYVPGMRAALFFATGTGIVPFLSMIKYELETIRSGRELNLYLGVRTESNLVWDEQLQALAKQYPNLHYRPFISRPSGSWTGETGHITSAIADIDNVNLHAYVCGGKEMVDEVEQGLTAKGVAPENIFYERFS